VDDEARPVDAVVEAVRELGLGEDIALVMILSRLEAVISS